MRLCLPEKSHSELRLWAKPTGAPGPAEKVWALSGMPGRLPVPPWPSTKVSLNEPWPLSAPPTALPFRYHTTVPTPWPPTRSDTSVPGTTKERGKLPAMTGPPGPPGGAPGGGTWASWSIRRCSNSWLARRSPNSSALALGNAVINATAAVNPPSAATVPIFRLFVIGPPKKQKLPTQRTHVPLLIGIITSVFAYSHSLSHILIHTKRSEIESELGRLPRDRPSRRCRDHISKPNPHDGHNRRASVRSAS